MKIWLAGVPGGGTTGNCKRERELNKFWTLRLWSYYHLIESNGNMKKKRNKVNLFLDSGAFSAWTQKIEINIHEYIEFIKKHRNFITVYANLDVIGIGGKQPNKLTAEATLENQKIMEAAGLDPLPCFHFGEPYEYLEYYIKHYDYIALGVAGNSGRKLIPWFDICFSNYICDKQTGLPKVKVHGFAVTSLPLMLRYPWYSVDSTSWVITGRMGGIFMPRWSENNKKWIYDGASWKIAVSNRSPNKKESGRHLDTLSKRHKEIVLNYIAEKGYAIGKSEFKMVEQSYVLDKAYEKWAGKKPENKTAKRELEIILEPGISNKYQLRDEMNIIYFLDLEKSIQPWPWAFRKETQTKFF